MKNQVVFIHGGETFKSYDEYLTFLKNATVDGDITPVKKWKNTLGELLGKNVQVIAPQMPNDLNAKYTEWKIWFEKLIPFFEPEVILVGHSLGGIFLAKYLAENTLPRKVKALFLVAAPFDDADSEYSVADFALPATIENVAKQCEIIHLYQSSDDPVVPYVDLGKYQKALPNANVHTFTDRQHFNQPEFPEIIKDIKALTTSGTVSQ